MVSRMYTAPKKGITLFINITLSGIVMHFVGWIGDFGMIVQTVLPSFYSSHFINPL